MIAKLNDAGIRVSLFIAAERRQDEGRDPDTVDDAEAWKTRSDNDFWGGKIDWQLSDDHLIEFLAFSDEAESITPSYDNYDWGTGATLLYNIFGERLAAVGTYGIPDVYEQPRGSLDLTLTQRLPGPGSP